MNLDEFLRSDERNAWIKERYMQAYVRRSRRYIGGSTFEFLDLANVEVDEARRGSGVLTLFLRRFEREARRYNRGVYVESILEPRLVPFLTKNGIALCFRLSWFAQACINSILDFL